MFSWSAGVVRIRKGKKAVLGIRDYYYYYFLPQEVERGVTGATKIKVVDRKEIGSGLKGRPNP